MRRLGDREDLIGVLIRHEPFGYLDEEVKGGGQDKNEGDHRRRAVPEHPLKADIVNAEHGIKEPLRYPVESGPAPLLRGPKEPAAEHRRQRDRDDARDQNGHADSHRKFLEQPAEDPAHEQHGDKHGRQRESHRHNRESDLAGTVQGGLKRLLPHLHVPEDVFEHDDGIVHDETDAKNQRHHGEVVEAVMEQIHDGKGPDDGERQRQARDRGSG